MRIIKNILTAVGILVLFIVAYFGLICVCYEEYDDYYGF